MLFLLLSLLTTSPALAEEIDFRKDSASLKAAKALYEKAQGLVKSGKLKEAEKLLLAARKGYGTVLFSPTTNEPYAKVLERDLVMVRCLEARKQQQYAAGSWQEVRDEAMKAMGTGRPAEIAKKISCDFSIYLGEADEGSVVSPETGAKAIAATMNKYDLGQAAWQAPSGGANDLFVLAKLALPENKEQEFALTFHAENNRWQWVGFHLYNDPDLSLLQKLRKNEKWIAR